MPDQDNHIVIIGDHLPGLNLALALASSNQPLILLYRSKSKSSKAKDFFDRQLLSQYRNNVSLKTFESLNNLLTDNIIIDNNSWHEEDWWQSLYSENKDKPKGWVSLVPRQIENWQHDDNFCGLIFYPEFNENLFAEIISKKNKPIVDKLKNLLDKLNCFTIETYEYRYISLAAGLQFHYLAIWYAHIQKINLQDVELLLGKAAGFLPQGILSNMKNNPYLLLLHQHKNQLEVILHHYSFVANLKEEHLLRQLPEGNPKRKIAELQSIKIEPNFDKRIKKLLLLDNELASFYQYFFLHIFQWASYIIKDFPIRIDQLDAIYKYAWQWPRGPFELWSKWEPNQVLQEMEQLELAPAGWVYRLVKSIRHFYRWEPSGKKVIDNEKWHYMPAIIPEHLSDFKPDRILWHRSEATISEVGDNILNLEFHSKLNMLDQDAMDGLDEVLQITASENYQGVVISNNGSHFTVGVNLGRVFVSAIEKDYEYIQLMIESFQQRMMKLKYAQVPVIMACHGYTIGGGSEMLLHLQNNTVAHKYAQTGLVETNAGLVPAGGGSKEMTIKASKALLENKWDDFIHLFDNIASGRINSTAEQAKTNGLLPEEMPIVVNRDRLLHEAKKLVQQKSASYQPQAAKKIEIAGKEGIEILNQFIEENKKPRKWSKKKVQLLKKAAYVFCGGNLAKNSLVEENYLLELEKEAFLNLCGQRYTLARMNKILQGKK